MIGAKGIPAVVGGVERIVEELSARLAERGHDVTVYARRAYAAPVPGGRHRGVRVRFAAAIPGKYTDTLSHAFLSLGDALLRRYDLLHVHSLGTAPILPPARLLGKRALFHVHGQEWKGGKWGARARAYFKWCEPVALRWARRTVVNSRASRDYYKTEYGRETTYIPNAVDVPPHRDTGILDRLGLAPRGYLLFVGRLVPEKGAHHLLAAHRALGLDIPVVVCGEPAHSDDYARALRASAGPRVLFAGNVLGAELVDLYARSLLLVNPTERDAVSLVLLEAMGQGAAVLASDIPEMVEGVGGAGFHFRAGDADDLARVLGGLLARPDRLDEVREPARRRVRDEYSWPAVVDQFEKVYRDVAGAA
jgi:glycosyltransferase involved in cell wall biosynthesis